jgi:hypothetical protein
MKYSMGDCLTDNGFQFYEKLHEPIFLISKFGRIVKINEAGRKLINIARLSKIDLECISRKHIADFSEFLATQKTIIKTGSRRLHLTTSKLVGSDYFLIELKAGR